MYRAILYLTIAILTGCSSTDISEEYFPLDDSRVGYSDTFISNTEKYEIYAESIESSKNAVALALLRARELCDGNFSVKEIESGVIVTADCEKCSMPLYYKGEVECKP